MTLPGEPNPARNNPRRGPAWTVRLTETDEQELLALIEGELSPEQERVVLARWQGRPEVVRFIETAIADRANLAAAMEVAAPSGLLNSVEQVLERDLLLNAGESGSEFSTGVEHGRLVSARPPSLRMESRRPWSSQVSRYATMAAAILLTVGGTVLTMQALNRPATLPTGKNIPPPLAFESSGRQDAVEQVTGKTEIASGPAEREEAGTGALAASTGSGAGVAEHATEVAPATLLAAGAEMTADHAMELARAGKLMIRVRTGSVEQAVAKVRDGDDRRLADAVTGVDIDPSDSARIASIAEVMRPLAPERSILTDAARDGEPVIAGDRAHDQPRRFTPAAEFSPLRKAPRRAVTRVDLHLSVQAIQTLREVLGVKGAEVELVELPEAMPADPPFDPQEALWWTRPPSAWTPRIAVPVVFEQR